MIDAGIVLQSLVGEPLATIRGRPNTIIEVTNGDAIVATSRSPLGQRVPVSWLQEVLDQLRSGETIVVGPASIGYRSSFLGAVLLTLPMIEVMDGSPPTARLDPAYTVQTNVIAELETRLRMYANLIARGGPAGVSPGLLRELRIYGGAGGVWNDVSRTRGIGGAASVTVGLLHTGRHYPDDLSNDALLY